MLKNINHGPRRSIFRAHSGNTRAIFSQRLQQKKKVRQKVIQKNKKKQAYAWLHNAKKYSPINQRRCVPCIPFLCFAHPHGNHRPLHRRPKKPEKLDQFAKQHEFYIINKKLEKTTPGGYKIFCSELNLGKKRRGRDPNRSVERT